MTRIAPEHPATLVEMLQGASEADAARIAYTFLDQARTTGDLWADVCRFAMVLVEQGLEPAGRVVIVLPNGDEFFTAFYGAQAAGGIAVPIYPLSTPERILQMAALCGAAHVVIPTATPAEQLAGWQARAPVRLLTVDDLADAQAGLPTVEPDDTAFIQYTSGTTGDPKGVVLSHRQLLTNVHQMAPRWKITPDDCFVSWVPCYHDMGLIAMTMLPMAVGARLVLLPTAVRDTAPWLDAIEHYGGTFTASPDFGYRLCLRHLAASGRADDPPDLSTLRIALNAAEAVRPSTIDAFHDTFGLTDVMIAGYGLAEATVGVSSWEPSTTNRVDDRGVASVGRPFPGVEVTIVDDDDRPVSAGEQGHILVTSPATTDGYYENPRATADLYVGRAIRTGDIGHVDDDGCLYIHGRAKDVIISAGTTIHPEEAEEIANDLAGVRYSAAIGVDHGRIEGEQLVVVVEIRPAELDDDESRKACSIAITRGVHDRFGLRPARVALVEPKTIPLTHNGKLRRAELRDRYLEGALGDRVLYPPRRSG